MLQFILLMAMVAVIGFVGLVVGGVVFAVNASTPSAEAGKVPPMFQRISYIALVLLLLGLSLGWLGGI